MRPIFAPELVNDPSGDPGLFVDFKFERRALLFDLGDNAALPPKKLLRVSDVFVSHTHMDHFVGFDRLVRVCLGRETGVRLYGPPGFVSQVEHRLASYTWNLVENYPTDFVITATELEPDWTARTARFRCHGRFRREPLGPRSLPPGLVIDEPAFAVRATFLDHKTPCLAFAVEEKTHVNIWKNRLAELGVPTGPWLRDLKQAILSGAPPETPIRAEWRDREGSHEQTVSLYELASRVTQRVENARRIAELAADADLLYIESVFLDADADHAARKFHLTAGQAGSIARRARARTVIPFHFSPRYIGREGELRAELDDARS